jgi:23S rRNA pseudouridine2605 synthase
MKLQKVLSQWGIASRRQAEAMIQAGRVQVNGTIAHIGQVVDPQTDSIVVDHHKLGAEQRPALVYLLLHKPIGVVSTCHDPQGRPTVLDLLPSHLQGVHPVGRLDVDSTGALLLTNDGEFTFRLTHPRHAIPKTYRVWVQGHPSARTLHQWRQGILLEGQWTLPAEVTVIRREADETHLQISLREGRNRQIRRVAQQLGHPVQRLHRVAIGSLTLADLPKGQWRFLTLPEIQTLDNLKI